MGVDMLYRGHYNSDHYLLQRQSVRFLSTSDLRYNILREKEEADKATVITAAVKIFKFSVMPIIMEKKLH